MVYETKYIPARISKYTNDKKLKTIAAKYIKLTKGYNGRKGYLVWMACDSQYFIINSEILSGRDNADWMSWQLSKALLNFHNSAKWVLHD